MPKFIVQKLILMIDQELAGATGRFGLWIQPVDATDWLNRSAGVS